MPAAFKVAAQVKSDYERRVRLSCRDIFRQSRLLEEIIPVIDEVLDAGGLEQPKLPDDSQPIAISPDMELEEDGRSRN